MLEPAMLDYELRDFRKFLHLFATAAALTPAATRQGGIKFGREHLLLLSVFTASTGEERDELLGV